MQILRGRSRGTCCCLSAFVTRKMSLSSLAAFYFSQGSRRGHYRRGTENSINASRLWREHAAGIEPRACAEQVSAERGRYPGSLPSVYSAEMTHRLCVKRGCRLWRDSRDKLISASDRLRFGGRQRRRCISKLIP